MSTHTSHHHHHHQHRDGASLFKQRSLRAIERNKQIQKGLFYTLVAIAILMAIAVVVLYRMD